MKQLFILFARWCKFAGNYWRFERLWLHEVTNIGQTMVTTTDHVYKLQQEQTACALLCPRRPTGLQHLVWLAGGNSSIFNTGCNKTQDICLGTSLYVCTLYNSNQNTDKNGRRMRLIPVSQSPPSGVLTCRPQILPRTRTVNCFYYTVIIIPTNFVIEWSKRGKDDDSRCKRGTHYPADANLLSADARMTAANIAWVACSLYARAESESRLSGTVRLSSLACRLYRRIFSVNYL